MSRRIELPTQSLPGVGARAYLRVDGRGVVVFNVEGALYAIDDSCPHAGSSLFRGSLSGRTLQCPAHGLRFDLASGCMSGGSLGLRTYQVESLDGRTFLNMPAAAQSC